MVLPRSEHAEEVGDALAVVGVVVPLLGHVDVVRLDVEDELVLGPLLLEGLRVLRLGRRDLVEVAEDLVHGEQRRRHARPGAQEVAGDPCRGSGRCGRSDRERVPRRPSVARSAAAGRTPRWRRSAWGSASVRLYCASSSHWRIHMARAPGRGCCAFIPRKAATMFKSPGTYVPGLSLAFLFMFPAL